MKIIVINANPKKRGALATLIEEASAGARESGADVEEIRIADQNIGHCTFCMTCYKDTESAIGRCFQHDDMQWILPKLKEADGYIMATQVSSGHANAIMKTFIERSVFTAGASKGTILWIKGVPVTRFTDKKRFAITIATAGAVPAWLRIFCNTATSQMKEMASCSFNANVVGELYAGELIAKGLQESDIQRARRLGQKLASKIRNNATG